MKSNYKLQVSACLFLLGLFIGPDAVAQIKPTQTEPFRTIAFGGKIAFGTVDNTARWTVSNQSAQVYVSLTGNQINDYIFDKPGRYELTYADGKQHLEGECHHSHFKDRMFVEVSKVKMTFDFANIQFSGKLRLGSNDDIVISVPVNVQTIDGQPVNFNIPDAVVAGVGSALIAKPIQATVLLGNGNHILNYRLSGTANKAAYLMIDFVDINNQVQSYSHPILVN